MKNPIVVRRMEHRDVVEVAKIGLITKELQIDDNNAMYYQPSDIEKALISPTELCLVAMDSNILTGYFLAHLNKVFNEIYISDLAIKPEYRGRGIGQLLMQEARKILSQENLDWSWALVQKDNFPMHKFMEKQGYKKGKIFNFYYKPSDF
jgi:ribosomal-protein-alanine N-acetyltransferase